jgi:hypothetical protein
MGIIASNKKKLDQFLKRNAAYVTPVMLLGGFFVHTITFDRVDRIFEHAVLVFYLLVVALCLVLLVSKDTRLGRRYSLATRESLVTAVMLFSFGSLFSGFLIFYAKSGSLISSWPFILLLLILMLGPEFKKQFYMEKLVLQISIFYIAIFSYLIFSIPVLVHRMGPLIYVVSGLVSLLGIFLFVRLLRLINPVIISAERKKIITRIGIIFLAFNVLYFTNVIPPIPLSLTFRAVYHDFSRIQGLQYTGAYEPTPAFEFWRMRSGVFHRFQNEPVYVYSQIYAPVNLSVDMYHQWEYFDPTKTRWVEEGKIKIPITGGRADGYRGYSEKENVWPGAWRVKIVTARGQTVGEIRFKIKNTESRPETIVEVFK